MSFDQLKHDVWEANLGLVKSGLVILTWGNVSGVDRVANVMAIKPSGVSYDKLCPEDIVLLSLTTGQIVEGVGRPSSDTPTHLYLYQNFPSLGGIVHTHSTHATAFAQAHREIPCLGTTHADNFYGTIPVTRPLTAPEIQENYELNTGKVIVESFRTAKIDPQQMPAVLVASHAPFTWGNTPAKALENAIVLEAVAKMELETYILRPQAPAIPPVLLDKHFLRKHGPGAYYGQATK